MDNSLLSHENDPIAITLLEWEEIVAVPWIREIWGLADDETGAWFAENVYGAKFKFESGSPGYCGDLYVLQGDALTGHPPVMLTRSEQGRLEVLDNDEDE